MFKVEFSEPEKKFDTCLHITVRPNGQQQMIKINGSIAHCKNYRCSKVVSLFLGIYPFIIMCLVPTFKPRSTFPTSGTSVVTTYGSLSRGFAWKIKDWVTKNGSNLMFGNWFVYILAFRRSSI